MCVGTRGKAGPKPRLRTWSGGWHHSQIVEMIDVGQRYDSIMLIVEAPITTGEARFETARSFF
jgi:hypothetical protein